MHELSPAHGQAGAPAYVNLHGEVAQMRPLHGAAPFHLRDAECGAIPLQDINEDDDPIGLESGFIEYLGATVKRGACECHAFLKRHERCSDQLAARDIRPSQLPNFASLVESVLQNVVDLKFGSFGFVTEPPQVLQASESC